MASVVIAFRLGIMETSLPTLLIYLNFKTDLLNGLILETLASDAILLVRSCCL